MIELVTGLPGAGKTLQTIVRVRERALKEGRQVYYDGIEGIDEKALPWLKWDGLKWFELPAGSIIVIDEAQRLFRPRGRAGEPPEHSAKLETHRHLGVDLVFITQNPLLIDSHVRRLCERHWHVMRKFGTKFSTIHEFPSGVREDCDKRREGSIRHEFRFPAEAFAWYRSAEVHTHKAHIPTRVWLLLLLPVLFVACAWFAWSRLNPVAQQERMDKAAGVDRAASAAQAKKHAPMSVAAAQAAGLMGGGTVTAVEYLRQHEPRVPGLAHTAPVYDDVTKPTEAPFPAACVSSAKRCQCYTQQGTRLDVGAELCGKIADGGYFVAWRGNGQRFEGEAPGANHDRSSAGGRPPVDDGQPPAGAGLGGFATVGHGMFARPSELGGGASMGRAVAR